MDSHSWPLETLALCGHRRENINTVWRSCIETKQQRNANSYFFFFFRELKKKKNKTNWKCFSMMRMARKCIKPRPCFRFRVWILNKWVCWFKFDRKTFDKKMFIEFENTLVTTLILICKSSSQHWFLACSMLPTLQRACASSKECSDVTKHHDTRTTPKT